MAKVLSHNTKPEILVRKFLFANGFRFRINVKTLSGKPDIVLPKYNTVIFIHGCFWHGHNNCEAATLPKTNTDYWQKKVRKNIERDEKVIYELTLLGWKIITIWECELKNKLIREKTLSYLLKAIKVIP